MKDILKVFTIFSYKQKRALLFIFFLMLIGGLLESVGIGAILPLMSIMGQPDFLRIHPEAASFAEFFGITDHIELVSGVAVLLVAFYVLKNGFLTLELYIQRRFTMKQQSLCAKEILNTYLSRPYIFHVNSNSAQLLRDVSIGPQYIFNNVVMAILYLSTELVTALFILVVLFVADFLTAITVGFIMATIIVSIIRYFKGKILQKGELLNSTSVEYYKWINQSLGAIKETKIMGKEKFFLTEFDTSYTKNAEAFQMYYFMSDIPRIIIESLVVIGLLCLIIVKISFGDNPANIIPILGVLAMAAFRLMPSANRIVSFYNSIKNQMPLFNDIYGVLVEIRERLDHGVEITDSDDIIVMPFQRNLQIQNLSFRYADDEELILKDISFTIDKGAFIGIIGPSGAGKTTFVDLLLGLLQPTDGKIICDGNDINEDIKAWQKNLAYVPQEIYLLDGSIRENIALGESKDTIDDDLIEKVLSMAELDGYVKTLSDGLDTFVGERGVKLSGGQRQRIGIARALYQKPEVLILDEATSALDTETEKSITDTILKFKGQITIIAIAHRVSTLEACDYKIKLENGKAEIIN